uniref:Uncharacterized protein n=2 Tax=Rhinopithecus TaxID=542827 RepID=A0A2K6K8X3_RHIBE
MWDVGHVGRVPAGLAEELLMEAAEEAPMGPTTLDPSLLPGGPLVSFQVAFICNCVSLSLHSHGDALHLFPRDRLDPETLDPGPPLE